MDKAYDPIKVIKKHDSFMKRIKSFSFRECWEWIGATDGCHGYGRFNGLDNKTYSAHRYSFMEFCGEIPKGMVVMHTCNNKKCVSPLHLELGTQKQNILNSIKDGIFHINHNYGRNKKCLT